MADIINPIESLPLYKHFKKVASEEEHTMLLKNIIFCVPLLDHVYTAFPTYTLHNSQHQVNIIRIMGELLDNDLEKLSSLEASLLILAAYYHDIGMVYMASELRKIQEEETFKQFIRGNYKAKLEFERNNNVLDANLSEWYCRWMHAKRVWNFLDTSRLMWGNQSLRTIVGNICESHNDPTEILNDDEKYEIDFNFEADIRFCSLLLRIADILDFDSTRSPKSVYEFLELDQPKNQLEEVSKVEWEKHLASNGFKFRRDNGVLQLLFSAAPKHPEVEKTIQRFLDIIEQEISACNSMFTKCSPQWRDFWINNSINRKQIRSENYSKGDYNLSLDEKKIITLLTGENLYNSSYDFLRELLQNAIDASRMREFHEHAEGNSQFKAASIHINSWIDTEGLRWVRIDDFGMGLNEYIIKNHLLKKGNSFYKSDYFKLQQLHYLKKTGRSFTPISRFGIGLLSCFMLGDKIEISSKSVALPSVNEEEQSVRLSISGLDGMYIFQTKKEKHQPTNFPSSSVNDEKFRPDYGTSVAVRIKGSKDHLGFEGLIKRYLAKFITCSPIDIFYNGTKLGVDFNVALNSPFTPCYKRFVFTNEEKNKIARDLDIEIDEELGFEIIPINITEQSNTPNLRGQICIIRLLHNEKFLRANDISWSFIIKIDSTKYISFKRRKKTSGSDKIEERSSAISIGDIFDNLFSVKDLTKIFSPEWFEDNDMDLVKNLIPIHNGINLPNSSDSYRNADFSIIDYLNRHVKGYGHDNFMVYFGIVYLQDDLIPDLSVSRSEINRIGFTIYSSLYFATKELNDLLPPENRFKYFHIKERFFHLQEVISDFNVKNGHWDDTPLIFTNNGELISINDLKTKSNYPIMVDYDIYNPFVSSLVSCLLEIYFELEYSANNEDNIYRIYVIALRSTPYYSDQKSQTRPMFFINFDNNSIITHNNYCNKKHPLIKWILQQESELLSNFENYYFQLINAIVEKKKVVVNKILDHLRMFPQLNVPRENISENDFIAENEFIGERNPI